jgi:hypothetical protein
MSASLSAIPNLNNLKRQGKKLLLGVRSGDSAALSRVKQNLPRQRSNTLKSSKAVFGQRDALLVIAREYGFSSWANLEANVDLEASDPVQLGEGMKQIFANLYRFDSKPRGKSLSVSHSYLIVRKQGNLLICNKYAPVTEYMDEIDALGGIGTQLIALDLDASSGDYHDELHACFGARLCYHEAERKMTRTKTKCPEIMFGDEGLKIGRDFEVFLFPNKCHTGTSLFRWRNRGKHYIFTAGVLRTIGEEWAVRFDPQLWPEKRALFDQLPILNSDYILPGSTPELEEDIHRLNDCSKKSLQSVIQEKLTPRQGGLKTGVRPRKMRVVTNYVPSELLEFLNATDEFESDKMKVHGNCALPLLMTYLDGADVMFLNGFHRKFRPGHQFLHALREHVEKGAGMLLAEGRTVVGDLEIASSHPFPEIGAMGKPVQVLGQEIPELIVEGRHPIVNGLADGTRFPVSVFWHHGHSHVPYSGSTIEPGPGGQVLVRNVFGDPVLVTGEIGKGRIALFAFSYIREAPTDSIDHQIYMNALRWLVGLE